MTAITPQQLDNLVVRRAEKGAMITLTAAAIK
jgi:hypothetical protein